MCILGKVGNRVLDCYLYVYVETNITNLLGSMASSMLKGLPVYNRSSFTRPQFFSSGSILVYIPTRDDSDSKEIVTERRAMLLRYLQQKMENKVPEKKRTREVNVAEDNEPIAKRLRSSHKKK